MKHNVLSCGLLSSVLVVLAFANGVNAAEGREQLSPEPVIVVDDTPFYSWREYTSSEVFRRKTLRCATHPDRTAAAAIKAGTPQDCTFFLTNPSADYDPALVRFRIPVVVHVIRQSNGVTGDISEAMVDSQIDILNEDFLALLGSNGENGTDIQVEFYLATRDPNNAPTNGITYSDNTTWFNDSGGYYNTLAWDTNRYLNIYTNSASGALGYVPNLPQSGIAGSNSDRVVILWSSFGRNGPIGWPFDQGRTATHEVGHYLGLEHTFSGGCASASGCYTNGDLICDTNPQGSPTSGCTDTGSCGSPNPIDNYMDYSYDLCMEKFTPEQARRMRCSLEHYRPDLYEIGGSSSCGNDLRENFEECDGTDDIACPGFCQGDCFCPAICFVAAGPLPDSETSDTGAGTTNRYLSIKPQNANLSTALRVVGDTWSAWVGEPQEVTENSGLIDPADDPNSKSFYTATLGCDPHYADWAAYGTVYVYHQAIVPGANYTVQAIRTNCDTALAGDYSLPLEIRMSAWGDVTGPFDGTAFDWTSPDGSVSVPTDIVAMLDKFRNRPNAPIKVRVDIEPATPNLVINVSDTSRALDSFRGTVYPFVPGSAPCP